MEKKTDLRIIRTKKNIKEAFLQLLQKKPVSKITVTEIARDAMINKGTFYLHYQDVYDLYDQVISDFLDAAFENIADYSLFFLSPGQFLNKFIVIFDPKAMDASFPNLFGSDINLEVPVMINQKLEKKLLNTGMIEKSTENRIRLECCISSIFLTGGMSYQKFPGETVQVLSEMIRGFFPLETLKQPSA